MRQATKKPPAGGFRQGRAGRPVAYFSPSSSELLVCWVANSTAIPSSKCRTTLARRLPTIRGEPIGGLTSSANAAPESEISITFARYVLPSGSEIATLGTRGTARSCRRSSGRFLPPQRRCDCHGEAAVVDAHDLAFDAADMIDVGDHALAHAADDRGGQRQASRRHVLRLAGEFAPVLKHETAEQVDGDALVPASVVLSDKRALAERLLRCRHRIRGNAPAVEELPVIFGHRG